MPYKDIEKRREVGRKSTRKFRQTEKYKQYLLSDAYKEQAERYENSEKGKATRRNYQQGEAGLSTQARYRLTEKSKIRTKRFLATEKGKEYYSAKMARYRERYPERIKAMELANRLLPDKPCSIDDCDEIGHKHHDDYNKPLDVVYLCARHHMELHHGNTATNKKRTQAH